MMTLPEISTSKAIPLDELRRMIRRDPDLKALGARIGPTRAYTVAEAEMLKQAFDKWLAKKAGTIGR